MKGILALTILISVPLWAAKSDCYKRPSQEKKNECMAFERDKAIGGLVNEVTKKCSQTPQMQEEEGAEEEVGPSEQPMILDECMSEEFKKLENSLR